MTIKYNDIYQPISKDALSRIPEAMKAAARWVVWGGKKVPVNGNVRNSSGYYIGADVKKDPASWLSFDSACQLIGSVCMVRGDYFHVAGIGFVVGDGWFCVDGDGGADHGREPLPESVISDLCQRSDTYAEISISKNGCHVFGRCDFVTEEGKESFSESRSSYEIEFFTRRKFIIVTGDKVPGSAEDAIECTEAARRIYSDYVLTGCEKREAEAACRREEYRASITIDPNDAEQFFLLNYSEILNYADVDHFKRKPGNGEPSWIGAIKAMDEVGIPRSAIYDWCRRGVSFAGEKDIDKVLDEKKASAKKSTTAAIVKDALENGWKVDPDKLTGEYKKTYENHQLKQRHREKYTPVLAALGIEYSDSLTWTLNFDGTIEKVIDSSTGEIIYPKQTGSSNPKEGKSFLTVGGFDNVEIKPTDYLFFPWFPRGKLTAVQGDSGSSKSTFMYGIGAKVSTGSDLLGVPCEDPGNVMFITIEDDAADIKIAFQDAGGDLSKLKRIIDREDIAKLNLSPAGAQIINRIIKSESIKLLVLDPLQQFLSGDMNKANETRAQLALLMNIAAENNICIVFLEHMGKDTSKAALHRGLGSVDIHAATRSVIQVVTDPEDDYCKIAFTVKNNTADHHETQRAIRYKVKDHPGSYDPEKKKRQRFHGHAEFDEIVSEYNERLYKKALKKADEAEEAKETLQFEYDDDPLVITARELVSYNPNGLFIGTDDFIQKITIVCGRCPYIAMKNKTIGIYQRIEKLRSLMIDSDGIQVDKHEGTLKPKPYNWHGDIFIPEDKKVHGVYITPVKTGTGGKGTQQTQI